MRFLGRIFTCFWPKQAKPLQGDTSLKRTKFFVPWISALGRFHCIKKYKELWDGINNKIENINDDECKYAKDFTKIKFDTDDDLPLKKPLNLDMLTIIVRSVFEDESKFYPQVYLDECLHES